MGQTYDGSIKERLTGRLAELSSGRIVKTWLKMRYPNATNCLDSTCLGGKHPRRDSPPRILKTTPIEN